MDFSKDETLLSGEVQNSMTSNKVMSETEVLQKLEIVDKQKAPLSPTDLLEDIVAIPESKTNDVCIHEKRKTFSPQSSNGEEESLKLCYNPFSSCESDLEGHSLTSDSVLSRIGPFADNRPICECHIVKKMTSSPDVRYLLSLLPDISEMNTGQKEVFKSKVRSSLNKVLEEKY